MAEEGPSGRNFVSFKIGNEKFYGERIKKNDVNGIKYLKGENLEWKDGEEKQPAEQEEKKPEKKEVQKYISECKNNADDCKKLEQKTDVKDVEEKKRRRKY